MIDRLIIVESPAKANTIKKFLGGKTKVVASMGHIRDLPKSKLGIDIEHNFELQYINIFLLLSLFLYHHHKLKYYTYSYLFFY